MRSSFRKGDPGYTTRVFGKVTVDGVAVKKCFTADEELGEAWCYATSEQGVILTEIRDGVRQTVEVCHRGKVVITPSSLSETYE